MDATHSVRTSTGRVCNLLLFVYREEIAVINNGFDPIHQRPF